MSELVIRGATADDWEQVADMGARIFSRAEPGDPRYALLRGFLQGLATEPDYSLDHARLGVLDGRVVAHVSVVHRRLRYGCAELPFGGIAAVWTHPDYRTNGFASAVMRDALDYMAQQGYALSLLDGIPRYYDRFGYVTIWPTRALKIMVEEALRVAEDQLGYQVRPVQPEDLAAVFALYEEEWGARACSIRRTADWLRHRLDFICPDGSPYVYVVTDSAGIVRGYSAGGKLEDRTEVIAADRPAVAALLRHTGQALSDNPSAIITWLDVPDTRAARYAQQLCSVHLNASANYHGGWMATLIHPQAALDTLRPELVARLRRLGVPGADELSYEVASDTLLLMLPEARIRLAHGDFLRLLFGNLTPHEIDDLDGLSAAARTLLKRMFPPVVNGLAGLDWF